MDRTAQAIAATLSPWMPGQGKRPLTIEETQSIEDVLDAALEWDQGRMTLDAAAHIGTLLNREDVPSSRYSRFVAIMRTPRVDPRWQALNRMVNLLATSMYVVTPHGLMESSELHQHDAAIFALRFSKTAA